jgi:hypothetical protein
VLALENWAVVTGLHEGDICVARSTFVNRSYGKIAFHSPHLGKSMRLVTFGDFWIYFLPLWVPLSAVAAWIVLREGLRYRSITRGNNDAS